MLDIPHYRRNRTRKFLFIGPDRAERVRVEDCLFHIKNSLARNQRPPIQLLWEKKLASALTALESGRFEGVLVDLFLAAMRRWRPSRKPRPTPA